MAGVPGRGPARRRAMTEAKTSPSREPFARALRGPGPRGGAGHSGARASPPPPCGSRAGLQSWDSARSRRWPLPVRRPRSPAWRAAVRPRRRSGPDGRARSPPAGRRGGRTGNAGSERRARLGFLTAWSLSRIGPNDAASKVKARLTALPKGGAMRASTGNGTGIRVWRRRAGRGRRRSRGPTGR